MYALFGGNTERGIAERTAQARAEEHWRRMQEVKRLQEDELARLQNREEYQKQQLERTQAMRAELALRLGVEISPRITYAEIERRALKLFRITRADLKSERRSRDLVFVRQFISYWVARRTALSLPQIGKLMGGRDHTTILHHKRMYPHKRAKMGRKLREVR